MRRWFAIRSTNFPRVFGTDINPEKWTPFLAVISWRMQTTVRSWCWSVLAGYSLTSFFEGKVKSSSLAYNRRKTREKRPLGRVPDRSWYDLHTSVKLFLVASHGTMDIGGSIRVCCSSVYGSMCCDKEGSTLVWRWHQLLSASLLGLPDLRLTEILCPGILRGSFISYC